MRRAQRIRVVTTELQRVTSGPDMGQSGVSQRGSGPFRRLSRLIAKSPADITVTALCVGAA